MAQQLRFGVVCPQQEWPAMLEQAQAVEALGFDSVWVIDHIAMRMAPDRPVLEAWTGLAALAARTSRVHLGTLTTNALWRNPVMLAKQAVAVDQVSGGRLDVGLGSGNPGASYPMAGIDPGTPRERIARFRETVQIVDRLLRGETVTFEGDYYHTQAAVMRPGAVQQPRPPLLIGAHQPGTLQIAAQYADTWNSFGGFGLGAAEALAATRQRAERLDAYCAALGRDPRQIRRSLLVGFTQDNPWASLDAFHDFVGRYRAIGIDEFIFSFRGEAEGSAAILERIARDALPALRAESTAARG
jgi:alkanesulfonate monooxygenase SsuD/methylene tetrahydromethanopterin reductase-like flavin-dependent oxidoreductase (luciferase family)